MANNLARLPYSKNLLPPRGLSTVNKSLAKYERDYLAGRVDPGIKVSFTFRRGRSVTHKDMSISHDVLTSTCERPIKPLPAKESHPTVWGKFGNCHYGEPNLAKLRKHLKAYLP